MCDISQGFKLCTCNEVDETKSYWKLFRFGDNRITVVGQMHPSYYERSKQYNWLSQELNERSCFDFEFTPQHGDRLIFVLKQKDEEMTLCLDYEDHQYGKGWRSIDLYANDDAKAIHVGYTSNE